MTYPRTREKSVVNFDWKEAGVEDELRRLHDDGETAPQIAHTLTQKFGGMLTRSAVLGKINRLGLSVAQQNTVWKEDLIAELKRLHGQGLYADRIADELTRKFGGTFTSSAVYHKTCRLGLSVKVRVRNREFAAPILDTDIAPAIWLSADEIPIKQGKKLLDLRNDEAGQMLDCRWPHGVGRVSEYLFCGAEVHPCESYCRQHCVIAYPNWHPRRRDRTHMRAA